MANNVFKIKRTSVTGRAANTSTLTNPGELALNMTDGIMYSTNGSSVFEVGANLTSAHITNSLTLNNDNQLRFKTVNTSAYVYFVQQSDDNFVFYTTNGSYAPRPIWSIYANSGTSAFSIGSPVIFTGANVSLGTTGLSANGGLGGAGQVLTSNGSATYWSTVSGGGGGSVDTAAQYIWTNTHTFSANVSFSDDIALNTNNAIYFGGLADANWRMARNSNTLTKWIYTNNTIDIVTANSPYEGFAIGLVSNATYFETGYLGTYVASQLVVGNSSSNSTINSTAFTGTANNTLFVGSVSAANVVSNAQLSGNLANYVTTTNLTNNLTNYQTTAGLSANVALLAANSATYLGNSSGTITNIDSWITTNAAAAYTNAVSYTDSKILTANGAITGNAATAYTNAVSYVDGVIVNVNTAITSNASAAYTNAVSYVDGKSYVNTSQLSTNLSNYQTTTGLAANVATLASNSATYLGNSSGTIANVSTWITSNSSAAYTNAVSYTDTKIGTANSAITGNAATAYTNAVSYVDGKSYVNTSQLSNNLSNYALLSGATFTGNVVANNANTTYDLNVGRNLTVAGNLTITGNVTVIGANTFSIVDNMFYLNSNNTTQNVDLGFAGNYNDGTYHHAGFFRDATDGVWKVFDNYDPEPDAAVNIDTTNTSFHLANFQANVVYVGNTTVYSTVNTTSFSGTSNNSLYLGGTLASGYQTTAGLSANVATLAANSATYIGNSSGTIANVSTWITTNAAAAYTNAVSYVDGKSFVNTSQLSSNLSNYVTTTNLTNNLVNYQTTAGLNANIAAYLPTYTGTVNAASHTVGTAFTANATMTNTVSLVVSTNTATIGTGTYFVSNGNIGIGTNAPTFKIDYGSAAGALGSTANSQILYQRFGSTDGNADYLEITNTRMIANTSWQGAGTRIQQKVDATWQGWIQFNGGSGSSYNSYGITFGAGGSSANATAVPEVMRIDTNGNLGIGNTSPSYKLHVTGTAILGNTRIDSAASGATVGFWSGAGYFGGIGTVAGLTGSGTSTDIGIVADSGRALRFYANTTTNEAMTIAANTNVGIGTTAPAYKLQVNGSFAATTKSFVIKHPTKPNMKLRYGSLEGPENGVYVRGRSNKHIIDLPDYWTGLIDEDSISVNLTPIGIFQGLFVEKIENNKIYVVSQKSDGLHYFYTVFAERKDIEKLVVEFDA